MALAPNYYYNSPLIAEIGRNLSSALAPPDPDKIRERQKSQFEFDYLKTKAGHEEEDRHGDDVSRNALGDLYKLRENPIYQMDATGKPITGKDGKPVIDEDAMDRAAYGLADVITRNASNKEILAQLDPALFEASSKFKRQVITQKMAGAFAAQRLAMGHGYRTDEMYTKGGIDSALQDQQDEAAMARLQVQGSQKLAEWQTRINAATKTGKPLTITQGLVDAVGRQIIKLERVAGHRLSDAERLQYTGEAVALLQATGDPVNAAMRVFSAHGISAQPGAGTREEDELGSTINAVLRYLGVDVDAHPFLHQTDTVLQSDPTAPAPTAAVPGSLASAIPAQAVNPIQTHGDAERDMEKTTRERMEAETAAMKANGGKPPPRRPPSVPKDPDKRKKLEEIFGK